MKKVPRAAQGPISKSIYKHCSSCRTTAGTVSENSARRDWASVHAGEVEKTTDGADEN